MRASRDFAVTALVTSCLFWASGCGQTSTPTGSEDLSLYAVAKKAIKGFQSLVGGNPVISRPITDSWGNFSLVDMSNPFSSDGEVNVWEVYANTTENVRLVIYRATANPSVFTVVGTSDSETPSVGPNLFLLSEPISVEAGDFVGLVNSGTAFTYSGTGSSVRWSGGPGSGLTGSLPGFGQRTYSVRATEGVTICHKPGTPAEKAMVIPLDALAGHLGHGDSVGACSP